VIRNIFSKPLDTITHAALFIGAASFLSRIIGLLRDRLLAHLFGAGPTLDAYYSAFLIPDFVYTLLIVGALSASFIPSFMSESQKDTLSGWKFFNATLIICGISLSGMIIGLIIAVPTLIPYIVPGLSGETQALSISMTQIMLISPLLLGLSSILSGVLQSQKLFFITSLSPIIYNIGIIFGALYLVPSFGPLGLAYGVLIGAALHLCIQIPMLFALGYVPTVQGYNHRELTSMFLSSIPRIFSLGGNQIQTILLAGYASTLAVGGISMFTFANNIQSFPVGLIGISFAIAAFPTLTKAAQGNKEDVFIAQLLQTMRTILICIVPLTIIFLLLRMQIVRVLLGSGAFDWTDTVTTGNTLGFFALSLFAQCLIPLLTRGFFAKKDTKTPSLVTLVGVILTIALGYHLKGTYGVPGLALAISLSSLVQLAFLYLLLTHQSKTCDNMRLVRFLGALTVSSLMMAVVTQYLKAPIALFVDMERLWGVLTQGAITATIGLLCYIGTLYLFQVEEVRIIKGQIKKKFFTKKPVITELVDADTSI
jgi:putative peptidoglycan lipid II flippase